MLKADILLIFLFNGITLLQIHKNNHTQLTHTLSKFYYLTPMKRRMTIGSVLGLCVYMMSVSPIMAQTAPQTTTVNNITVTGDMVVEDVTITKDTLKALDHVIMQENLEVKKDVSISGHIDLGNGLGMRSFAATATRPRVFNFGTTDMVSAGSTSMMALDRAVPLPGCLSPVFTPNSNPIYNFQGFLRAYAGTSGAINLGHDGANGIIDIDGTSVNSSNPGALLLNYYCERNVAICTGPTDPGSNAALNHVYIGDFLNARKHVEIGNPLNPINSANNVALEINAVSGKGIVFNTWNNTMPLISIKNNNFPTTSPFTVFGNGKTVIVTDDGSSALDVINKTDNKVNFRVKQNGYIYAREINVMPTNINFPDYVFDQGYQLLSIEDLAKYVQNHHHLPNIPPATEVKVSGIYVGDLQMKQMEKLEEAFLYIIQLKQENTELKQRLEKLEQEIKK